MATKNNLTTAKLKVARKVVDSKIEQLPEKINKIQQQALLEQRENAKIQQQRQSAVFNTNKTPQVKKMVNNEINKINSIGQKNLFQKSFLEDVNEKAQQAALASNHSFEPTDLGEVEELSLLKTGANALVQTGKGLLDFGEGISDTLIQAGSSKLNPFMWVASGFDKDKLESMQSTAKDIIKSDSSEKALNALGYNKKLSNGKTVQETIDEGSLVRSDNLLGQAFRSGGAMLPSLMMPSERLGLAIMGVSSYGSGVEEAYQNNANRLQANAYGVLNALIETGTEKLGGLLGSNPVSRGMRQRIEQRVSNEVVQRLLNMGLDMFEEGSEELLGDILQPFAQKLTYANDEDLEKLFSDQDYLNDFIVGGLTAGIMGVGSNVASIQMERSLQTQLNEQVNGRNKNTFKRELMQMGFSEIKATKMVNKSLSEKGLKLIPTNIEVKNNKAIINNVELDAEQIDNKIEESTNLTNEITDIESSKRLDKAIDILELAKQEINTQQENIVKEEIKTEPFVQSKPETQQTSIDLDNKISQTRRKISQLEEQINQGKSIDSNMSPSKLMGLNIQLTQLKSDLKDLNEQKLNQNLEKSNVIESTYEVEKSEPTTIAERIEKTPETVLKFTPVESENRPTSQNIRSWSQTATEGDYEGVDLVKDISNSLDNTYMPQQNKIGWEKANKTFNDIGYEASINRVVGVLESGKKVTLNDVMLGQRMLQEAAKNKDVENISRLLTDLSVAGTEMGQNIQALSIIKRLTPVGQLKVLQKTIDRMKVKSPKVMENVELTDNMINKVLDSENVDDLNKNVDEVKKLIAEQMQGTIQDKIDAWRYFSMLGNPKTHIRNLVSNVAMLGTRTTKKIVQRAIEGTISKIAPNLLKERTVTFKKSSQEVKNYVKDYIENNKNVLSAESKYAIESQIAAEKKAFGKTKAGRGLQKVMDFNSNLLENEDMIFKSTVFKSSMSEYLTANGIITREDIDNNPKLLNNSINYAIDESLKATFQQYSALANSLNQLSKRNKVARFVGNALLPFKKTPINIAKTGLSYSPAGLIKTVTANSVDLKNNKISVNEYIDNISQGLTGTGILMLGYVLAKNGILHGKPSDDDKEKQLKKALGQQNYSVTIGNKNFTIDWLTPTSMPLLTGVTISEMSNENNPLNLNSLSSLFTSSLQPLVELSFLQSLDDTLSTYGTEGPKGVIEDSVQSYISQFFPTLGGQLAKTIDPTVRTTAASKNSKFKFGEELLRQNIAKIPGLTYYLEPSTDLWGNDVERNKNVIIRAFDNFLNPASTKDIVNDSVSKELQNMYSKLNDDDLLPNLPSTYYYSLSKEVKFKNVKYQSNAKEYTEIKKTYGETAYKTLNKLFKTDTYKNSDDDEKLNLIKNAYTYAKDKMKKEFLSKKGVEYTNKQANKEPVYKDNAIKYVVNYDMSWNEASKYAKNNY